MPCLLRSLRRPRRAAGIAPHRAAGPARTRADVPGRTRATLIALLLGALAACGRHDGATVRVVAIAGAGPGAAISDRRSPPADLLRGATAEGLVAFDADGRIVPAMADRWIVTDGGLTYIFRLRDGRWPDGGAITGEAARAALREAIAAQAGTPLALDLARLRDVRAMAGRVIEIRLTGAMPDLLMLLAQPELGLLRHGKGNGPLAIRREGNAGGARDGEGAPLHLAMIAPPRRGLPAIDGWAATVRPLSLTVLPGDRAIAAFTGGGADVVLGGGFADLPRLPRQPIGTGALRFDAVTGLFGLLVVRAAGFLATPSGREALAMAIDRDSLATGLGAAGWAPTTRIVPPGPEGEANAGAPLVGERWADIDLDGRRTLAARRTSAWLAGGGGAIVLRVALPPGPGADILFTRLASDFQDIGIGLRRAAPGEAADLRLIDAVARYPRPEWFVDRLSCAALRGPCSAGADGFAAAARAAADPAAAALAWAQAQNALADSNVFIPFGPPVRWSLVRSGLSGFAANRAGIHPLAPLATRPPAN